MKRKRQGAIPDIHDVEEGQISPNVQVSPSVCEDSSTFIPQEINIAYSSLKTQDGGDTPLSPRDKSFPKNPTSELSVETR